MSLGTLLMGCLIFGAITGAIGDRKNLSFGQGFLIGALLGPIGVIIALCQKPGLPRAPRGMRALTCPRCNAVQNVMAEAPYFVCWQCHVEERVPVFGVR